MPARTSRYAFARRSLLGAAALLLASGCVGESETSRSPSDGARITFETGNEITEVSQTRYSQEWSLLVTNRDGQPIEGATVELSVRPLFYYKGAWVAVDTNGDGEADAYGQGFDSDNDGEIEQDSSFECISEDRALQGVTGFANATFNGRLDTEDADRDGVLDSGEDLNGNGILDTEDLDGDGDLEPSNDAAVTPGVVTTGSDGFAEFALSYPKGNATWSKVRIEAGFSGTANAESRSFKLVPAAEDVSNLDISPPGSEPASPYGIRGDCSDPG